MTISSRTPEEMPHRCPICGKAAALDPSSPGGDPICPDCGQLLRRLRDRLDTLPGADAGALRLDSPGPGALGGDLLGVVPLVMAFEEEFGVAITDAEAERFSTVRDVLRFIERQMSTRPGGWGLGFETPG